MLMHVVVFAGLTLGLSVVFTPCLLMHVFVFAVLTLGCSFCVQRMSDDVFGEFSHVCVRCVMEVMYTLCWTVCSCVMLLHDMCCIVSL